MPDPVDMIDAQLLKIACPETPIQLLAPWADPIRLGCRFYHIEGVRPVAALLAQAAHESGGFQRLEENLNYSAQGLANTWPNRFAVDPKARVKVPNAKAVALNRKPMDIANTVYANRLGNGPPESGDGWRYRGYGPFQLTGAYNQGAFARSQGIPLEQVPTFIRTTGGGAMSMCWFFNEHGLEDLAKTPGVADETEAINGGVIGLADRKQRFDAVVRELLRRGA
jgi:putative chitinase